MRQDTASRVSRAPGSASSAGFGQAPDSAAPRAGAVEKQPQAVTLSRQPLWVSFQHTETSVAPATVFVLLMAGVLLVLGAILLGAGLGRPAGRECPKCLHRNPAGAKFCAHCGHVLSNA
jgi:hypothetical protein